uniref:Uncharacterized protein n=1 Tax=Anguilla anguilla TaxID=7936 RepID=A0A0E9RUY9_ANGAN
MNMNHWVIFPFNVLVLSFGHYCLRLCFLPRVPHTHSFELHRHSLYK